MDARELVQGLATAERLEMMRLLVGGVNAGELRDLRVTPDVFDALVLGLRDPNPKVRWWCVQILDHLDDALAVDAIATCLDDPVPRVRRNAAHALGCVGCKPSWDGSLPAGALDRLTEMAAHDPNAKVRSEAARTLACTGPARDTGPCDAGPRTKRRGWDLNPR